MSKDNENIYYNFPITLLENDINKGLFDDLADYHLYKLVEMQEVDARRAAFMMGIKYPNPQNGYNQGKRICESVGHGLPHCGISFEMWWDFYKNEKTQFEKDCLRAFLSLKSIIGNKPYCKVTKDFVVARMGGQASTKTLYKVPKELKRYTERYQFAKIMKELSQNWGLVKYSYHTRGVYVSFNMDEEQLVNEAERRRKSTWEKSNKKTMKELRLKAQEKYSTGQVKLNVKYKKAN